MRLGQAYRRTHEHTKYVLKEDIFSHSSFLMHLSFNKFRRKKNKIFTFFASCLFTNKKYVYKFCFYSWYLHTLGTNIRDILKVYIFVNFGQTVNTRFLQSGQFYKYRLENVLIIFPWMCLQVWHQYHCSFRICLSLLVQKYCKIIQFGFGSNIKEYKLLIRVVVQIKRRLSSMFLIQNQHISKHRYPFVNQQQTICHCIIPRKTHEQTFVSSLKRKITFQAFCWDCLQKHSARFRSLPPC